jgi:radical SAM superfamily enzyme YgiQ (UPF0313 family)
MSKLRVMLADLKFFNKYSQYDVYVPLNLGYIVSHVRKVFGDGAEVSIHLDATKFIDQCLQIKPDLIGFSVYTWNYRLTRTVIRVLREQLGPDVVIVLGGPTVSDDEPSQTALFASMPGIDAIIPGEGEIGLVNLAKAIAENDQLDKTQPIQNVVLWNDELVYHKGAKRDLLDLSTLDSPYLTGILDEFMVPPFKPMLQTTRGCPYLCTFCVLGSNTQKLRKIPTKIVEQELIYLAKIFGNRPHSYLFVVDDNFGIFKEDLNIAKLISSTHKNFGYPLQMGFYVNKQITETTKAASLVLKDIHSYYCISLQSDNPETLKLINRKNVPEAQMHETINWLKINGLTPMTELIFGLPHDTKASYIELLEKTVDYGFERISSNTLLLLDGADVNKLDQRKQFCMQTKFRLFMNYYGYVDGEFTCEAEEIVTGSNSFNFDDFLAVRCLSFMFYAVYMLRFNHLFFKEISLDDIKITDFFQAFIAPDRSQVWPEKYLTFLDDLKTEFISELFDTKEELVQAVEARYQANGCNPLPPTKINVFFGSRLLFLEQEWHSEVLGRIWKQCKATDGIYETSHIDVLLLMYQKQLIEVQNVTTLPEPLISEYDLTAWLEDNQTESLMNYKTAKPLVFEFYLTPDQKTTFVSMAKELNGFSRVDGYYAFVDNMGRRLYYSFHRSGSSNYLEEQMMLAQAE